MSEHQDQTRKYIILWAVLLAALVVSLVVGEVSTSTAAIAFIFAVALVKAWLVVAYYMHLAFEPWIHKVVVSCAILATFIFYGGVYTDVHGRWAVISEAEAKQREEVAAQVAALAANSLQAGDPTRGATVYATYCQACHQADGKGMDGKLAANFVDDKSRLAKTDEELKHSITNGFKGNIGQMPAWGATLKEQQVVDVIAHLRATYGAK